MNRTLVNGYWVYDPIKDYSNGKTITPPTDCELPKKQLAHVSQLLKAVDQCTKMTDAKVLIRTGRASYPTKRTKTNYLGSL